MVIFVAVQHCLSVNKDKRNISTMQEKRQEKSIIKRNISQYLAFKGISDYQFYKETGVSRGVLSQNNGLSEDNLMRFLGYYDDVNPAWVVTGEGNMLKGEDKLEFLESRNQGEFDLNQISFTKYRDKIIPIQVIPLYEFEATAGFLTQGDTPDAIYDYIRIPRMSKVDGASFVLGDSMTPTLKSGDIVVFKQYHDLQSILYGEMYLISILIEGDFHLVIKYIHRIEGVKDTVRLVSSNPTHQPIDVKLANIHAFAHIKASIRYHTML